MTTNLPVAATSAVLVKSEFSGDGETIVKGYVYLFKTSLG